MCLLEWETGGFLRKHVSVVKVEEKYRAILAAITDAQIDPYGGPEFEEMCMSWTVVEICDVSYLLYPFIATLSFCILVKQAVLRFKLAAEALSTTPMARPLFPWTCMPVLKVVVARVLQMLTSALLLRNGLGLTT